MKAFDVPVGIWRKSRHSVANGNCVQVAVSSDAVMIRDSADSEGPVISYPAAAWRAFVAAAKMPTPLSLPRENRSSSPLAAACTASGADSPRQYGPRLTRVLITAIRY